ncbi:hypothetical protein quinque_008615 [Culex quinquefasciatus]
MIETAHLNSDEQISLSTLGRTYTIDFHSMQRVNGDTGTTRTVQRKINHALLAQPQGTMIITAGTPTTLHHTNHQRMSTTAARHHQPEAGSSKRSRLYQTRPHLSGTYAYNAELGILTFPSQSHASRTRSHSPGQLKVLDILKHKVAIPEQQQIKIAS